MSFDPATKGRCHLTPAMPSLYKHQEERHRYQK